MNTSKNCRLIKKLIKNHNNIFIMGHSSLDLDAIGACVGFSLICNSLNKDSYIIINDKNHEAGVKKLLTNIKKEFNVISGREARKLYSKNDLLVIVDVNKARIVQDEEIVSMFSDKLIIDHHEKNDESISDAYEIIEYGASSTCEILTKYFYYYGMNINPFVATMLLGGIVLDTNNYTIKTNSLTFFASYYLSQNGASSRDVQYLLKQNLNDYKIRQRVITDAEIINKNIALAVGSQKVKYKREELAKIADTLLAFDDIDLSFVIGKLEDDTVGISGRSIGKTNVGTILSRLGGGGDRYEAACKIDGKSLKEVEVLLKDLI